HTPGWLVSHPVVCDHHLWTHLVSGSPPVHCQRRRPLPAAIFADRITDHAHTRGCCLVHGPQKPPERSPCSRPRFCPPPARSTILRIPGTGICYPTGNQFGQPAG